MCGSRTIILERFENEGEEFFSHLVTGDETWISYTNVESKQKSMQWCHSSSPKTKKFKQAPSIRKMMATAFWDQKGVLFVAFLKRGVTINADAYRKTLKKLRHAI